MIEMTEHERIVEALRHLRPKAQFRLQGTELMWTDPTQTEPTQEEIDAKVEEIINAEPMRLLREERNRRLSETDWRDLPSYPGTDQNDWRTYRQALRDLPSVAEPQLDENGQLTNVTWPTKPE